MIDLNIFESELWGSSGYCIVTTVTWNNIYIDSGKPFLSENSFKTHKNHKVCRNILRFPKKLKNLYFLECESTDTSQHFKSGLIHVNSLLVFCCFYAFFPGFFYIITFQKWVHACKSLSIHIYY